MYSGLNTINIKDLRNKYGKNSIDIKSNYRTLKIFISQFTSPLVIVLLIAGLVTFAFGSAKDGVVILIIVIINSLVGFIQEYKAERILQKLKKNLESMCVVVRDGLVKEIPIDEIVPGDLVKISEGTKVPADGILLDSKDLYIDESLLTGESLAVTKSVSKDISNQILDKLIQLSKVLPEYKSSYVYTGTFVKRGSGQFVVIKTGLNTEFGKIAQLTSETKKTMSPLQIEMASVGKYVGFMTVIISGFLFVYGFFFGNSSLIDSIIYSASVAIAAVPESLPTVITLALAIGVQKLARNKTLVRHLSSVESLGETTVICSDKTGTLTQNKMAVRNFITSWGRSFELDKIKGYDPRTGIFLEDNKEYKSWQSILKKNVNLSTWSNYAYLTLKLCNDSTLKLSKNKYEMFGDPTEGALTVLAMKLGNSGLKEKSELDRISFDSERKMMSVLYSMSGGKKNNLIFSKGAPEVVLSKCSSYLLEDGTEKKMTKSQLEIFDNQNEDYANLGLRVIALAYKSYKGSSLSDSDEHDLVFIGLVAMYDPPREDVKAVSHITRDAGIRTIIITGDNPKTATSIAREIGFFTKSEKVIAYTHDDLETMTDKDLAKVLDSKNKTAYLFARAMPLDKLRIVEILEKQGEVVAVTGDGVNDAPAIQRAHIGIAMGDGTDVSKEAAHIVLMNNSFATIVQAIQLGREVYINIRRFCWYVFSSNIGELFVVFSSILFAIPSPLTPISILLIDLGTDLLPAISLTMENETTDIMKLPPKSRNARIINSKFMTDFMSSGFFLGIICMLLFVMELWSHGWTYGQPIDKSLYIKASTLAFAGLVMVQLANSFNAKSLGKALLPNLFSNKFHIFAVIFSTVLVCLFMYVPFFQNAFNFTGLDITEWLMIVTIMIAMVIFGQVKKLFFVY